MYVTAVGERERVAGLSESRDNEIWSWVLWDLEPRMNVLVTGQHQFVRNRFRCFNCWGYLILSSSLHSSHNSCGVGQIFVFPAVEHPPIVSTSFLILNEGCMNVWSRQWKLYQFNFPIIYHSILFFFLETILKSTSHSVSISISFGQRDILCWLCIWLS
jgi:hypothetical protein